MNYKLRGRLAVRCSKTNLYAYSWMHIPRFGAQSHSWCDTEVSHYYESSVSQYWVFENMELK